MADHAGRRLFVPVYLVGRAPQTQNSVAVQAGVAPNQSNAGGLSFEIRPSDARVIVDGHDVGSDGQFTPTSQALALALPVGRHHIEIVADGYRTMSSDVDVRAGHVIPFQGDGAVDRAGRG